MDETTNKKIKYQLNYTQYDKEGDKLFNTREIPNEQFEVREIIHSSYGLLVKVWIRYNNCIYEIIRTIPY